MEEPWRGEKRKGGAEEDLEAERLLDRQDVEMEDEVLVGMVEKAAKVKRKGCCTVP